MRPPELFYYGFSGFRCPVPGGLTDKTFYEFTSTEHAVRSFIVEPLSLLPTYAPAWLAFKREKLARLPDVRASKIVRTSSPAFDRYEFELGFRELDQPMLVHQAVLIQPERAFAISSSGPDEHRATVPTIFGSLRPVELPPEPVQAGYQQVVVLGLRVALPEYLSPPAVMRFESRDFKLLGNVGPVSLETRREPFDDLGVPEDAVVSAVRRKPYELRRGELEIRAELEEVALELGAKRYAVRIASATFSHGKDAITLRARALEAGGGRMETWWRSLLETTELDL